MRRVCLTHPAKGPTRERGKRGGDSAKNGAGGTKEHTTGGRGCRGWREREKETRGEEMGEEEESVEDEQAAVGESGMEVLGEGGS